jgi:hypothetical protein
MTRTLKPVFIALLLVASAVGPAVAATEGSPDLSIHLPDNRVGPGDETTLDLFVLNGGSITSGGPSGDERRVTTARKVTIDVGPGNAPIDVETSTQPVGSVPEGRVGPIQFQVSVARNATPGEYDVPVEVSYEYTSRVESDRRTRNHNTKERTIQRTVTLVIDEQARFAMVNASTNAFPGEAGDLTVTLRNVGNETATASEVSLRSDDPALTLGGATSAKTFEGNWGPGEMRTVTVTGQFGAESRRSYSVLASVNFENDDGQPRTSDQLRFGITPVAGTSRFPIVNASADLAIGERGTVEVQVRNAGRTAVKDAAVTVQSTDPVLTLGSTASATSFAGRWQPGEVRTFELAASVGSEAEVRSYPLSLFVDFETADGESRRSASVTAGIVPQPEQSFSLAELNSTLAVGDEGKILGTVTNTGETVVRNPVVVLSADNTNLVPVETEYAIGNLQPGESAPFEFTADVTDAADAGPRQLSFVVRYRDADNDQRRSDPLDARVDVGPRQDRFGIEPVSATFQPGATDLLELRVTNAGSGVVSDVSAKLFTDDPLSSDDDEAFISELAAGESTVVRFSLSVASGAVERKVYPVSLDFQYEDADGDTRLSNSYDVAVQVTTIENEGTLPTTGIAVAAVVLLAVIAGLWYRRRS